jgi:hypothetical protein
MPSVLRLPANPMSRKTLYSSVLAFGLSFAVSVFALWTWNRSSKAPATRLRPANAVVLAYENFGPPSMVFELQIGPEWNQWKSEGHELPDDVPVQVVVYRDMKLEQVRKQFPVVKGKSDHRYLEYHRAIAFLDEKLKEVEQSKQQSETEDELQLWDRLQKTLTNTRAVLVNPQ